jgi:hypothetical protein
MLRPNQALKLTVASRVQLTWLSIGLVQMIKLSLWDLFRLVQYETYQRRSLAPVRYAARVVRIKLFFRASTKIL